MGIMKAINSLLAGEARAEKARELGFGEPNAAQRLMLSFYGPDPQPPRDYKAPHAYRGTPPRPKTPRHLRAPKRLFRAA